MTAALPGICLRRKDPLHPVQGIAVRLYTSPVAHFQYALPVPRWLHPLFRDIYELADAPTQPPQGIAFER